MTESELLNLIEQEEAQCIGTYSGDLAEQRRKALQYYYSQPYGNEIEGRSQVVTSETLDAVEGILPSLMAIFTSSDEVVRFEPQGPEDEEAAKQATDYVNYIFSRANNGFLVLYCLFKDALLQKNGFCKVYWEEYEDYTKEQYKGLTDDQFTLLAMGDEVEVVAHTKYPGPQGISHDAVIRTKKQKGKICLDPVPPEEVLISKDTPNDLKKARFVEHRVKVSVSRIREMGYEVPDDITDDSMAEFNVERMQRNSYDDSNIPQIFKEGLDPASREVWLCEAYPLVDYDGDGITERRKVLKVGKKILDNVEFDGIPLVTGTPILMPHKIYGLSIADLVMDIQLIKSTITRQLLDNAYHQNNRQYEVLDGMVNMDDMLTSRPGGIKRVKVLGAIKPIDVPLLGQPIFNLLGYFDQVKESRVGKRSFAPGPNADILKGSATGAEVFKQWDDERTQLIARILAETCVKELFWKILELTAKHQTQPQVVKLRNKWVTIDPREWKDKFNMTVTVGLGTNSHVQIVQSVQTIFGLQLQMIEAGMGDVAVTPQNLYKTGCLAAKALFPKDAEGLFTDPKTAQPKQPQPNTDLLKIKLAAKKADMGDKQKRDKMLMDFILEKQRMGHELSMQEREFVHDAQLAFAEMSSVADQQHTDLVHDHHQKEKDRQTEVALAQHDARTRIAESRARPTNPAG